jgi:hypothetical protein
MMWRQQPESDIGFPRTTEISYSGEATAGPFEQYDLSGYCTSETHAVKVGAYRLARRKFITHTLRLKVRPANYNSLLTQGDIVRVRLRRETALAALDYHDYLYEIERIEKTASGACIFDLTHFPIDSQGRSLVALEVAAATAPGAVIASGRSDYSCDDNSSTPGTSVGSGGIDYPAFDDTPGLDDTTVDFDVPTDDEWATGGYPPIGPDVSQPAGEPSGGQTPIGSWDNPADPLESTLDQSGVGYVTGGTGTGGAPLPGDTLSVSDSDFTCAGQVCWSKINKDTGEETEISCQDEPISGSWDLSITTDEIDHYIVATGRCKDPSTASGWGPPQSLGQTLATLTPECTTSLSAQVVIYRVSSIGCGGCGDPTDTVNQSRSYTVPVPVYKSYTISNKGQISADCVEGTTYQTYAAAFGIDWVRVGASTTNANNATFNPTVDALCAIFTISKDQGSYVKGQKLGWIVSSYGGGAIGCVKESVYLNSLSYNNTVSCT